MFKETLKRAEEIKPVIRLANGRELPLSRPLVMGILNVTSDSFSDGGQFVDAGEAVAHAEKMITEGVDIIDIGGESTRPGAEPVRSEEERERVIPVIRGLRAMSDIPISIDTYRAETAEAALDVGADIINDISALRFDDRLPEIVATANCPVVLMHMLGTPRDMQQNPTYADCVSEIADFFDERIEFCRLRGIDKSRIILDPGIGFGKRLNDNLDILSRLSEFDHFGLPVLIGVSRKSFIEMLHSTGGRPDERIGGSIAAAVVALANGAAIFRVHDVGATVQALKVAQAVIQNSYADQRTSAEEKG